MSVGASNKLSAQCIFSWSFRCFLFFPFFTQVNLDKLYILTVNYVFKNKLMPLLLDQTKCSPAYGSSRDTNTVIQNIFKHAHCIQNPELAAATIHKISQELPAGQSSRGGVDLVYLFFSLKSFIRTSLHLHINMILNCIYCVSVWNIPPLFCRLQVQRKPCFWNFVWTLYKNSWSLIC